MTTPTARRRIVVNSPATEKQLEEIATLPKTAVLINSTALPGDGDLFALEYEWVIE